jgi:hypothetical protein
MGGPVVVLLDPPPIIMVGVVMTGVVVGGTVVMTELCKTHA